MWLRPVALMTGASSGLGEARADRTAWTAFTGGETVRIPALNDTDALARLAAAEAVVMACGNRSVLTGRYR